MFQYFKVNNPFLMNIVLHCRFINLLSEANLDPVSLWTHVKTVRSEYRNRKNRECQAMNEWRRVMEGVNNFISDEEREVNFESLSNKLQVSNVSEEVKNVPKNIIDAGGEMFVPALHWQNFYHHLLYEHPNSEIILSVLNARKNSLTKGSKLLANKVLGRLADILKFEYHHLENKTEWTKNMAKVQGKQTLEFKDAFCFIWALPACT